MARWYEKLLKTQLLIIKMLNTTLVRLWWLSALSTLGSQTITWHLNSSAVLTPTVLWGFLCTQARVNSTWCIFSRLMYNFNMNTQSLNRCNINLKISVRTNHFEHNRRWKWSNDVYRPHSIIILRENSNFSPLNATWFIYFTPSVHD